MAIEDQLRERLRKWRLCFFGAATAGERDAASAAAERLKENFVRPAAPIRRSS